MERPDIENPAENIEAGKETLEKEAALFFKEAVEAGELDPSADIELLSGNNSEKARNIKARAFEGIKTDDDLREFSESISGDNSAEANIWRNEIKEKATNPFAAEDFYARSVAGEKSGAETYETIKNMAERGAALDPILRGLAEDDSEKAWEIREMMVERVLRGEEWPVAGSLFQSLAGVDGKRADATRAQIKAYLETSERDHSAVRNPGEVNPETARQIMDGEKVEGDDLIAFAHSIAAVDSEYASEAREQLKSAPDSPAKWEALLVSTNGLDTPETRSIRDDILKNENLPHKDYYLGLMAKSLAGVGGEHAEGLRKELEEAGVSKRDSAAGRSKGFVFYHKPL